MSENEQKKFEGISFEASFTDEIELDESGKIFRINRCVFPSKVLMGNPDVLWNGGWS